MKTIFKFSLIIIPILLFLSVGVGFGITYKTYEDAIYENEKIINDSYNRSYISKKPIEISKVADFEVHKYNIRKSKRTGLIFLIAPIPFKLPSYEKQTEIYIKDGKVFKIIYRNDKVTREGFGMACSLWYGFGGGGLCDDIKGMDN